MRNILAVIRSGFAHNVEVPLENSRSHSTRTEQGEETFTLIQHSHACGL
jgi:hypothetical protein